MQGSLWDIVLARRRTPMKILPVIFVMVLLYGCGGQSNEVLMVQGGKLGTCPSKTVQEMVDGFMGSPSWESITADDGFKYVNINGDITFQDKPVRATIQFKLDSDKTFKFQALEFNEVPQNNLFAWGLLEKMCES